MAAEVKGSAEVHNRMPVILPEEAWAGGSARNRLKVGDLKALLAPYPADRMVCWPVSARVGNAKNNDPSLIEPAA